MNTEISILNIIKAICSGGFIASGAKEWLVSGDLRRGIALTAAGILISPFSKAPNWMVTAAAICTIVLSVTRN